MTAPAATPRRLSPRTCPNRHVRTLALALVLAPSAAHAGNGDLPRTPIIHQGQRCLTLVDRSLDPIVHLAYTIPFTDTCLTADELPGSRSHQLVAFCHGDPRARILPHWLTRAEADAAAAAGQTDLDPVPAADVLADNPDYAGCWHPIIPTDQRRPIACPAARPGVDWDTRDLPPGAYLVRGYTYEPPLNTWSPRHGLYKVVDHADDDSPPAVAIANADTYLWKDQPLLVRLCAHAIDGATVTLSYGDNAVAPTWHPAIVDHPIASGDLDLELLPPPELAGTIITLRAEIVDPMDRRFVGFMQGEINIQVTPDPQGGNAPADPELPVDPAYDYCADNPDADRSPDCPDLGTSTSDSTSDSSGLPESQGEGGCSCRSSAPAGSLGLLWLLSPLWLSCTPILTRRRGGRGRQLRLASPHARLARRPLKDLLVRILAGRLRRCAHGPARPRRDQ